MNPAEVGLDIAPQMGQGQISTAASQSEKSTAIPDSPTGSCQSAICKLARRYRLATVLAVGRRTTTVHAPSSHIQLFTVAVIKAAFEIVVIRDIVDRIRVVFGPSTAMAAGQKSHECQ